MISTVAWVRRGAAKAVPDHMDMNDEEVATAIRQKALEEIEEAKEEIEERKAQRAAATASENVPIDPSLAEFNLENYDEEVGELSIFSNVKALAVYQSNDEDPYITLKGDEDDEEDAEDITIRPTDCLILAGKTEDDVSHLEIYVYEEDEDNLYVHHDLMLPSFPLCVEWMDFVSRDPTLLKIKREDGAPSDVGNVGNFAAVGTMDPEIEIWDLDVYDSLMPAAILGAAQDSKKGIKSKKSKKDSNKKNPNRHVDSVLGLSWNKSHRNILASCSADATIKIWDLTTLSAVRSFEQHQDKVQAVVWNPKETTVLASASFDKTVKVFDSRTPQAAASWALDADPEAVKWDPFNPERFFVCSEDGMVKCFDVRKTQEGPIYSLQAHDRSASTIDVSTRIPGMIVTGSVDRKIKVWNVHNDQPSCVLSRDLEVGRVFTASFCSDSPYLLCTAGGKGNVAVWNMAENAGWRQAFQARMEANGIAMPELKERPSGPRTSNSGGGLDEDEEEGDDEDDEMDTDA